MLRLTELKLAVGHSEQDLTAAILKLADREDATGEVLNLGSGRETTIEEIVRTVADIMGSSTEIERAPARAADVRRHCADVKRAEAIIGTISQTSLEDGLAKTVDWYISQAAS